MFNTIDELRDGLQTSLAWGHRKDKDWIYQLLNTVDEMELMMATRRDEARRGELDVRRVSVILSSLVSFTIQAGWLAL